MKKRIGRREMSLIAECVKDNPSFEKIERLFEQGADPNAVNGAGESVLFAVANGYCCRDGVRSGEYMPKIVGTFISYGFDLRRHGLKAVSALQNGVYDRHMRAAVRLVLKAWLSARFHVKKSRFVSQNSRRRRRAVNAV